jgi:hypothetical protein
VVAYSGALSEAPLWVRLEAMFMIAMKTIKSINVGKTTDIANRIILSRIKIDIRKICSQRGLKQPHHAAVLIG